MIFSSNSTRAKPSGSGIRRRRGATLVEVILYTAILSMILIALVDLGHILRTTRSKFVNTNYVHAAASRVVQLVDFMVRNSDGLVEDINGNDCFSAGRLWLYFATSSISYLPDGCMDDSTTGAVGIEYDATARGVLLRCYQDYPAVGKAADCSHAPVASATTTYHLVDTVNYFVPADGFLFATTTVGSRSAVEINFTIGARSSGFTEFAATTTASTTTVFRSATTTAP